MPLCGIQEKRHRCAVSGIVAVVFPDLIAFKWFRFSLLSYLHVCHFSGKVVKSGPTYCELEI